MKSSLYFALLLLAKAKASIHSTLFPSQEEEYDFSILDPYTIYGSPYGGFGRATTSRLAQLPLFIPDNGEQKSEEKVMTVRDYQGRQFVCQIYAEDELDPGTISESLFELPQMRDPNINYEAIAETQAKKEKYKSEEQKTNDLLETPQNAIAEILRRLDQLKDMCGQIHKGWWSFQWCYKKEITQFHVHLDQKTNKIELQDSTSLGIYKKRVIKLANADDYPVNQILGGKLELGRVYDHYEDGQLCAETNKPRETVVTYQCCSDSFYDIGRNKLQKQGHVIDSREVALLTVSESPDEPCKYNVTVCTEHLCNGSKGAPDTRLVTTRHKSKKRDSETISEILDRTLGSICVHTVNSGWWTYELCHTRHVRQFHVQNGNRKGDDEYFLGHYPASAKVKSKVPDYELIVNATDVSKGGGNHAYFEIEYIGGNVCDDSEVTDRAIVAGNRGVNGKLERASTVRFYCGSEPGLYVNEDSTCHYIVEVYVPSLCQHPLFVAPATKREVVKCLPLPGDEPDASIDFAWIESDL